MAPRDCRPTEMPPTTVAFAKARDLGRAMRVVFRVGGRIALVVYNVYGFPGGHHCREAATRTNAIVEAVIQEATQRGDLYVAIVGDLNADTADIPAVTELLQGHGWTDLGAHPRWLAGRPPLGHLLRGRSCWHQEGLHPCGPPPRHHGLHLCGVRGRHFP